MGGRFVFWGATFGFLSVALGAFGRHALEERLDARGEALWSTAGQYGIAHAVALLAVGIWLLHRDVKAVRFAGWAFAFGTLVFCGTLYALALGGPRWLGAVTPLGGTGFLAGWACLAWTGLRQG